MCPRNRVHTEAFLFVHCLGVPRRSQPLPPRSFVSSTWRLGLLSGSLQLTPMVFVTVSLMTESTLVAVAEYGIRRVVEAVCATAVVVDIRRKHGESEAAMHWSLLWREPRERDYTPLKVNTGGPSTGDSMSRNETSTVIPTREPEAGSGSFRP